MMSVRAVEPREFDVLDFNGVNRDEILKRLELADALFLSGGNSAAILHAIDRQNLRDVIQKFAEEKVYCGISASSHIASKDLSLSTQEKVEKYYQEYGYRADKALGFVDFYIRSHYGEERFAHVTEDYVANLAKELASTIYGIDDQTAVTVEDGNIKVISEGSYKIFEG